MIYQPIENTGEYTTGTVYSESYVKSLEQEIKRLQNELDKTICKNIDLHSIIKEVRELVESGTDFKCITFRKADENTWKLILASHIKEDFLEILDKENKDEKEN